MIKKKNDGEARISKARWLYTVFNFGAISDVMKMKTRENV